MPFTFFDHTGDVGVDLAAPTLEALFATAAEALTATLTELEKVDPRETRTVTCAASAVDLLLVDWLSELLYRFDVDRFLVRMAEVQLTVAAEGARLEARVVGERYDPSRHPIAVLVKAVTYHALEVARTASGWRARVVFDI